VLSPSDAELIRRDPAIPGLPVLLDVQAFAERLSTLRPDIVGSNLANTYLRYKPGTNCLAAYQLQTPSGPVDLYAKAYARGARSKFEKAAAAVQQGSAGSQVIAVREMASIIFLFPADRRLKLLEFLESEEFRRRLLQKLAPDRPFLWEGKLQRLQYKPERRYVARVSHDGLGAQAALKFYNPAAYKTTNIKGFQSGTTLRVPKRLGRSNRHCVLLFEWLAGSSLAETLPDPHAAARVEEVGLALAELHGQHGKRLIHRTASTEAAHLQRIADAIGTLWPPLAQHASRLAAQLADSWRHWSGKPCTIHGDFHPKQVVLMDDGVGILDLDEAAWGDPALDLGNFAAHLDRETLRGRLSPQQAEVFQERLLAGYRRRLTMEDSRWQVHAAAALFRLATDPFRYRERDWPQQIEAVLQRAEERLEAALQWRRAELAVERLGRGNVLAGSASVEDPFDVTTDPGLDFVAPALDVQRMQTFFERRLPHSFVVVGRISGIRVVRHKPGRRCLIEYDVQIGEPGRTETITLLGKVRGKGFDRAAYSLQQDLWERGFHDSSEDGVSVPEPIGAIPELHLWLQRKTRGLPAWKRLLRPDGATVAARIAEALFKLHQARIPPRRRHTMRRKSRPA
jgi:hypothetical protein